MVNTGRLSGLEIQSIVLSPVLVIEVTGDVSGQTQFGATSLIDSRFRDDFFNGQWMASIVKAQNIVSGTRVLVSDYDATTGVITTASAGANYAIGDQLLLYFITELDLLKDDLETIIDDSATDTEAYVASQHTTTKALVTSTSNTALARFTTIDGRQVGNSYVQSKIVAVAPGDTEKELFALQGSLLIEALNFMVTVGKTGTATDVKLQFVLRTSGGTDHDLSAESTNQVTELGVVGNSYYLTMDPTDAPTLVAVDDAVRLTPTEYVFVPDKPVGVATARKIMLLTPFSGGSSAMTIKANLRFKALSNDVSVT